MRNDYWEDYLMHGAVDRRNDWNDYLMHRQHKYIKKIGSGRNARYFYTMDELRAYYKLQSAPADAAYGGRSAKNKLVDKAQDLVEPHLFSDDYAEEREKKKNRKRFKRDLKSWARMKRGHGKALLKTARKAIRGRSKAERLLIP